MADVEAGSFVQRFLFEDLDISGVVVCLRESWQRMHARRDYPPHIRMLLGELAAVTTCLLYTSPSPRD